MYKITKKDFFNEYSNKWENYSKDYKALSLVFLYNQLWRLKRIYWSLAGLPYEDIKYKYKNISY